MPPPSMDPAKVLKTLRSLGERSAGFAFAEVKSPGDSVLAVEAGKDGGSLLGVVRKEVKVEKACCGSVQLRAGNPLFMVDGNPGGFQRLIEEWLKRQRSPMKPTVVGAGGPRGDEARGDDDEKIGEEEIGDEELFDEEAIRKHVALARKGPVNFGFGFGGAPEEDRLALHRRLAPESLSRRIRELIGSKRNALGTMTVDGSVAAFSVETAPGGLEKRLRLLLTALGLRLQVEIRLPPGVEPEPDPDEAPETAPRPSKGPRLQDMVAELSELNPAIQDLTKRFPRKVAALKDQYALVRSALDAARDGGGEALGKAREELDRLRGMIDALRAPQSEERPAPPLPPEVPPLPAGALPDQAELLAGMKALTPDIKALVERFPRHVGPLREQYDQVRLAVKTAKDDQPATLVAGRDALELLRAMIREMEANPPSDEDLDAELDRINDEAMALEPEVRQLGQEFPRHSDDMEKQSLLIAEALHAGRVAEAEEALATLRKMVEFLRRRTPEGREQDPVMRYRRARRAWMETQSAVTLGIRKIGDAILAEYGEGKLRAPVRRRTERLQAVTRNLDTRLLDALDEVIDAGTPELRRRKVEAALAIVKAYADYASKDPLLRQVDENPFVELSLRPLVARTIDSVRALMEPTGDTQQPVR